eukprot:5675279-Prymnesium_polylepis.1
MTVYMLIGSLPLRERVRYHVRCARGLSLSGVGLAIASRFFSDVIPAESSCYPARDMLCDFSKITKMRFLARPPV